MPELPKPAVELAGNLSKAQRGARVRAEEMVNRTEKPKASEQTKEVSAVHLIFKRLVKGSQFNIDDSDDLNALAFLIYHKSRNEEELNGLVNNIGGISSPEYAANFNLLDKQVKQMTALRNSLGLTNTARLRKVVDMAKIFIEEEKAKQNIAPQMAPNVQRMSGVLSRNKKAGI